MAIVTVSRGSFSGARELARLLAEQLEYRLVSREDIIEKTARYGITEERRERARRRRLGILQRADLDWKHYRLFARAALTQEIQRGSLIYLGSNGRTLLQDFPNVLNVKVAAHMDYRVDKLMKRTDYVIDRKQAKRLIEEMDQKKFRWQRTFQVDRLVDPFEFDLTIEPGAMSISDACELISTTIEQPRYQTTDESLETMALLTAAAELRAQIAMQTDLSDDKLDVELKDGVVLITGSVRSIEDINGIKSLLDSDPGANGLIPVPGPNHSSPDLVT